ncbi:adenosylmethionine--8-amino-7-oxononanoate transaminase [Persicirhabdus sediminis]|uniref:Adenosylmethionine-8-amino-7-oxononanoate aminotransferase n=1 Tax=Persicirhabdus sediminis TaxID=454144 RepID=A0A8J7SP66_9BACT|nr:adenosylmethionine--8-amino-7-oxononanoate transaminase [Persicirhabdus sediminis]MBK1792138.1 adenosylmethionine--8-amino-7-oxononanoate transaminase [Persicirhabdus sediminis]
MISRLDNYDWLVGRSAAIFCIVSTEKWIEADKRHGWHPFTRQAEWCAADHQPLVLVAGEGVWLEDSQGNRYIDGNSSIWTNVHGHAHPVLNAALAEQAQKVCHTSYLGFANPRASELAERLAGYFTSLQRVFFSDDGSTAMECALKMEVQYRQLVGQGEKCEIIAFDSCYHGDTMGAASLGGVDAFASRFRSFGMPVRHVSSVEQLVELDSSQLENVAALVIEPMVQGVNQIHVWPEGMLVKLREWCDAHDVHLIFDEVMTGFGRTGKMFACQHEAVEPDFLCLAKGLTGGYLPLAATLTNEKIYSAFIGSADRAFYYGHSYTANQLGCAVALANLDLFESENTLAQLAGKIQLLSELLGELAEEFVEIYDIRQCGFVAGVELRQLDGKKFPLDDRLGEHWCVKAREFGLLTRPVLDTIVVMPPLSITEDELRQLVAAMAKTMKAYFNH